MHNMIEFPKRIKKILGKQAGLWLLLVIAVIILLTTISINYLLNYITKSSLKEQTVYSWEYIYTDNESNNYDGEWKIANKITPLSKERSGNYLHLRSTFDKSKVQRTLQIITDYAPIKASINGNTVYNNHFGESGFVGNTYNAIVIPASNAQTEVELSIYLPFSAYLQTSISETNNSSALSISAWLIISSIILLIGIIALLISFVLLFTKKKNKYYFTISLLLISYGISAVVSAASRCTYLINFPEFYSLSIALVNINVLLSLVAVSTILKIKEKKVFTFYIVYFILIAVMPFQKITFLLKSTVVAATIISVITAILLINICKKLQNKRVQYTKAMFLMLSYLAMISLFISIIFLFSENRVNFSNCEYISGFIFLFFIIYILMSKTFLDKNVKDTKLKIKIFDDIVEKVSLLLKEVISARNEVEICRKVAENICNLYSLCNNKKEETKIIGYCVLIKENSSYREICNEQLVEQIDYKSIENRYYASGECCLFGQTYFDFILLNNDAPHIIFHFENLENGLDLFFVGIMKMIYSCIDVAVACLDGDVNLEQKKESVFVNLAKNAEINGDSSDDHLECVAKYTKVLLEEMNYPNYICEMASNASMLHDIGKIAIPFEILNKPGLLSESERSIMKMHTKYGYMILSAFDGSFMNTAANIAKDHHEQYNGKGYNEIANENISEYARVVAVADVFDALTTRRSYKEAWSFENVIKYVNSNSGTSFDPKVISALNSCVDKIRQVYMEKKL